ncbi:Endonuclease/exonuclease/phosphatase [Mycotypha africana]|uniref:Endonuclease/exonuclease/phosphatase n=1 Tax=Mycotypha africana TaxID=64632 RepID=UPI0022FFF5A2|nr:Endonuclease/exonuclease/phosphatase [Mycotypha africana]KAI8984169.1 Endonuclease/exonuclease/phosphatase [Mycotypha africana]
MYVRIFQRGLAVVAKHRNFRMKAIAKLLSDSNYDIVTLQEVWVAKDFTLLKEAVKETLPYSAYFYSGALGSGLAILSKFPIISTSYHRYTLNGKPLKLLHGDFYVGKGVGSILVNHPVIGLLEVFTTHLHGGYGPKDIYKAHRATECWQLAHLLRSSAAMGRHIILSGDFNLIPTSYNYRLISDHGFMTDSWLQLHGEPDPCKFPLESITPDVYTQYFGFTCNSPFNNFSRYWDGGKDTNARQFLGKRLDYIFYRQTTQFNCIESKVVMTDFIPNSQMNYSDHFGVASVFAISHPVQTNASLSPSLSTNLCHPNYTQLSPTLIDEVLDVLKKDLRRSKKESQAILYLFFILIIVHIIFYILLIVLPSILSLRFNTAVPTIVVTVIDGLLMTGTGFLIPICLIVGFAFGRIEQRSLLQFINEVDALRRNLLMPENQQQQQLV